MINLLRKTFGFIFESLLIEEINKIGTLREVSAGEELIRFGEFIKGVPLMISGAVRVNRVYPDGNELFLYYIEEGDTCSMSLNCCTQQKKSEIRAVAEIDSKFVMIPVSKVEGLISKYPSWRQFVFSSYHNRMVEVVYALEKVAFEKLDDRLAEYLHQKSRITKSDTLQMTHQEIAEDLRTSRVVISRLLKKLEQMGKLKLQRNIVELITEIK